MEADIGFFNGSESAKAAIHPTYIRMSSVTESCGNSIEVVSRDIRRRSIVTFNFGFEIQE